MSASLNGKSVIVTGGSKGIARVFAGHGAKVLIVARHLRGTFLAIKACLQHLKKSSQGERYLEAVAASISLKRLGSVDLPTSPEALAST